MWPKIPEFSVVKHEQQLSKLLKSEITCKEWGQFAKLANALPWVEQDPRLRSYRIN
jgi:hypothetical protein